MKNYKNAYMFWSRLYLIHRFSFNKYLLGVNYMPITVIFNSGKLPYGNNWTVRERLDVERCLVNYYLE